MADVRSGGDQSLHGPAEVRDLRAPQHGDEFKLGLRQRSIDGGRGVSIVVVPRQVRAGLDPDLVVFREIGVVDVDEAALGRALEVLGEDTRQCKQAENDGCSGTHLERFSPFLGN